MAIEFKRGQAGEGEDADDRRRREAERTREEFGIATLSHDEELIDDETFSQMHDRLANSRIGPDDEASPVPHAPAADAATRAKAESDADDELLLEEIATVLPSQDASGTHDGDTGPPLDAAAVAHLERQLLDAKDRDQVACIALSVARHYATAAALFVVNKGLVAGLRGSGGGLEDRIEGIMIPTDADSLMAAPIETARLARSSAPLGDVDQRVLRAMGREDVHHVAVLPIAIGTRVVNLLYVDAGPDPLSETGLAALRVLCIGVGKVYERLVVERKKNGPAGGSRA